MKLIFSCLLLISTSALAETYRMNCSTPSRNLSIEWQMGSKDLTIDYESEVSGDIQLVSEESGLKIIVDGRSEDLSCSNPQEVSPIVNVNQPGPRSHYTKARRSVHCGPINRIFFRYQCYGRNAYQPRRGL